MLPDLFRCSILFTYGRLLEISRVTDTCVILICTLVYIYFIYILFLYTHCVLAILTPLLHRYAQLLIRINQLLPYVMATFGSMPLAPLSKLIAFAARCSCITFHPSPFVSVRRCSHHAVSNPYNYYYFEKHYQLSCQLVRALF